MQMKLIFTLNDIVTHVADALKYIAKEEFDIETFDTHLYIILDAEDADHVVDYLENQGYPVKILDSYNNITKLSVDMED